MNLTWVDTAFAGRLLTTGVNTMAAAMDNQFVNEQTDTEPSTPGPWPWYVLLATGMGVGGLFPWLMVSFSMLRRGGNRAAILTLGVNIVVYFFIAWFMLRARWTWWSVLAAGLCFNLLWTTAACIYQKRSIGSPPPRYPFSEWKSWLFPLFTGMAIGLCTALLLSIPEIMNPQMRTPRIWEALQDETVLWKVLRFSLLGLVFGAIPGLWWAGEHRNFRPSHIITFFSALVVTFVVAGILGVALLAMVLEGDPTGTKVFESPAWALIPPWVSGFPKYVKQFSAYDVTGFVVVPLLFGAVSRIRDFWRRALLVPLVFVCGIPIVLASVEVWSPLQQRIIYDMSSPDDDTRDDSHVWASILLERFPDHQHWPWIADRLAAYYCGQGRSIQARELYERIVEKYGASNRWHWTVEKCRSVLSSPGFGRPGRIVDLRVPMTDYEEYLSQNWMALISVIRFWEGEDQPDSSVKIKLKAVSRSDDQILLAPIVDFADLDDAASGLGYHVLILPTSLQSVRSLVENGIPVIHSTYNNFHLIRGIDESRSIIASHAFFLLSERFKKETPKEAKEILALQAEGKGESRKRLKRIALETEDEHGSDSYDQPQMAYVGPHMAVVVPEEEVRSVAEAFNEPVGEIRSRSDGYLKAFIAINYLNAGDPVNAIKWAQAATGNIADPIALHTAHLAYRLWESRHRSPFSEIGLKKSFPVLNEIDVFMTDPETEQFLDRSKEAFDEAFAAGKISHKILSIYLSLLDSHSKEDLKRMIPGLRNSLSMDPAVSRGWFDLANSYERAGDMTGVIHALRGLVSASPHAYSTKVRLAYELIRMGRDGEADSTLDRVDRTKVASHPDYLFCMGAIAQGKGETKKARGYYERAMRKRRYDPVYHLKYGRLLSDDGEPAEARKYLEWAARIDAGEKIMNEAAEILSRLERPE